MKVEDYIIKQIKAEIDKNIQRCNELLWASYEETRKLDGFLKLIDNGEEEKEDRWKNERDSE